MKKVIALSMTALLAMTGLVGCRDGLEGEIEIDHTKTQLYVYNYDGGVGSEWFDKVVARFEQEYAGEHFEQDKTGVQIIPKKTKSGFDSLLQSSKNAVFFVQQAYYNELISQNKIMDITDVVKAVDGNGVSIESRLTEQQKDAFTALDGNYYALPHYTVYSGVTYDKDLFEERKLYLSKAGGFTNYELSYDEDPEYCNLSVGPDGVAGTYDDGLPSTIEEFSKLCAHMVRMDIIPFIYSGAYQAYSTNLINGLWAAYTGAEDFSVNFTLDSGDKEMEYVSGFDAQGNPTYASTKITMENAYYTKAQSGKLYALQFLEEAYKNGWFDDSSFNKSISHTDCQRKYIYSYPESEVNPSQKPIAMLIEGSYWYNEANQILQDAANKFPLRKDRNFAMMPLPTRYDTTTAAKKNTLVDANSSFAFLSANVKDDPVAVQLGKEFLKFCYTEESLQEFTVTTGVAKGVQYDLTPAQYGSMSGFYKNSYDIQKASNIVYPYASNRIFLNHQADFAFAQDTRLWTSGSFAMAMGAIKDYKYTAQKYFEPWTNFETLKGQWDKSYGKYYE